MDPPRAATCWRRQRHPGRRRYTHPVTTLRHLSLTTRTLPVEPGVRAGPRIIASTSSVDRYSDIIDQRSMQLDAWKANPILLYGHEWDGTVVGRAGDIALDPMGDSATVALAFTPMWDDHPVNPKGQLVAHQWGTFLHAVSVGGYAHTTVSRTSPECPEWARGESGFYLADFEVCEVSVVPIPANTDVGERSAKGAGFNLVAEVRRQVKDSGFWREILSDPETLAALRTATLSPASTSPVDDVDTLLGA